MIFEPLNIYFKKDDDVYSNQPLKMVRRGDFIKVSCEFVYSTVYKLL